MQSPDEHSRPSASPAIDDEMDIAIVGLSCRFPGASNIEQFWKNLAAGVESITRFSDEEILKAGVPERLLRSPSYVKAAPVLEEPGLFDAGFFGFSPTEARTMDPQHRILLELAVEALENAGCNPERYSGRIGVFAGSAMNTYFMHSGLEQKFAEEYIPTLIVNDKDFLSTRISYKLNLKGPSITIQTACSTSLVAVHLARQSLLSEETDMALAGAISVRIPHRAGYVCDGGGIVSPDAHVRAFDAKANGTVFGSGGGVIVLKRLADAIASGDTVYAVIKGSAINNDGSEKAGYTAPSINSQADAVVEALANAGVEAESIDYIEAHGSGTPVGDPIEVAALTKAFRTFTQRSGFCRIGSVKTNVGHLDAAAGMAGMIKTVLAFRHRQIPPTLHYTQTNPEINFAETPFQVNTTLIPWTGTHSDKRRAGVMSTGMGGTNAFVVLEEAPTAGKTTDSGLPQLLTLSAKNAVALDAAKNRLLEYLERDGETKLQDIAHTLQTGRKAFAHRAFLVCADKQEAITILREKKGILSSQLDESIRRPLIFLLPGVGDHYVGMAHNLYENHEVFREQVDRCATILKTHLGFDIRETLYPANLNKNQVSKGIDLKKMLGSKSKEDDPAAERLNETIYAQPALFTIEYSLARLWEELGIVPDAIIGHSMGEYVAACLAGVLSLEDALRLIATRAKLAQDLPRGAMLAVMLSEAEILPLLNEDLSIALINGPNLCVVAGPTTALAELERTLDEKKILTRPVKNAHAFHSRMLDPIVSPLADEVAKVGLHEPRIPYISNVTGKWITKAEATDPTYWAKHANHTARFSDGLQQLWRFKNPILLEVGPGKTLGVLAAQHPDRSQSEDPIFASSLRHHYENQSDVALLLSSLGRLWLSGIEVKWEKLSARTPRHKIALPTYPFQREKYWIEPRSIPDTPRASDRSIHKNPDLSKWFYAPSWKRTVSKNSGASELSENPSRWLVFSAEDELTNRLLDRIKNSGQDVVTVKAGATYQQIGTHCFSLRPDKVDDYESLVRELHQGGWIPDYIIHGWSFLSDGSSFQAAQDSGFYSLLFLTRALAKRNITNQLRLFVLSEGIHDVHGNENSAPEKSTLIGPCLVIPQEYPNIRLKNIDLESPIRPSAGGILIDQIVGDLVNADSELFVAYRNNYRWLQNYEGVELFRPDASPFRQGGVYLITGGSGNIGYEISKYLAAKFQAKLVLIGRSGLPERKFWESWTAEHQSTDVIADKIRRITEVERLGGEVLYLHASVHDGDAMRTVIDQAYERFGKLDGVIHGAGVIGAKGYCEVKDIDVVHGDLHFQPKAHGLRVLAELLDDRKLDFCLLLSSLTSILGGVGQAGYAAANIYMDAFARRQNRLGQTPWLSVNWDVWRLQSEDWNGPGLGKTLAELGMTAAEAIKAMEIALLAGRISQVVVSTGDLQARVDQWVTRESADEEKAAIESGRSERPSLSAEYQEPRSRTEESVATIWQNVLGLKQVGTNDNFADLGGHSLLAIKIVADLRNAFQVDLPVRALFDTPTVAGLSAYIDQLKSAPGPVEPLVCAGSNGSIKANDILTQIGEQERSLPSETAFVVPHWFIHQTSWLDALSDSAIYNYPLLIGIRGSLNAEILRQSLEEIVRRHQVLRSVFRRLNADLVQIVVSAERHSLSLMDLSGLPAAERDTQLRAVTLEEANRPFDLSKGPLLRTRLIRLAPNDHVLQITTHHLVHDDWSTGIFLRELCQIYRTLATEGSSLLPKPAFNYAHYVQWHREQLQRQIARVPYWKGQLSSKTGFQHLKADFARPSKPGVRGARERIEFPPELVESLKELSRRERVSLFMVLLAGFKCLLRHYSGHEEIGVASCAANRPLGEVQELMGRFGNDILLRTSFAGDPTFRELLVRVRDTALTAYSDQNIPFGALLQNHAHEAEANGTPPFQIMFILQNAPKDYEQIPGLNINWMPFYNDTAKFDLNVWLTIDSTLEVVFEYRTDIFRESTMKKILADYAAVLQKAVKDPGARCCNLFASRNGESIPILESVESAKPSQGRNGDTPSPDVQSRLVELWEAAFKIKPIGLDKDFFELGGDSLLGARLFTQIETVFQIELPLTALLEAPTIRQLAEVIGGRKTRSSEVVVVVQSEGTKPPLFCVYGHGGGIFYFGILSRSLGPDQPLYGLRLEGFHEDNNTVEQIAAFYLEEIRKIQPKGPYCLSGYCFGGMVAYEIASRLKAEGEDVALLVLFNSPAPGSLRGWPYICLPKRFAYEARKLWSVPWKERTLFVWNKTRGLWRMISQSFGRALWRALPQPTDGRQISRRFLSGGNINVVAAKAYHPPPYPGQITLFVTAEIGSRYIVDPRRGWAALAMDGLEIHPVPGDNVSFFEEGNVEAVAEKVRFCLERVYDKIEGNDVNSPCAVSEVRTGTA